MRQADAKPASDHAPALVRVTADPGRARNARAPLGGALEGFLGLPTPHLPQDRWVPRTSAFVAAFLHAALVALVALALARPSLAPVQQPNVRSTTTAAKGVSLPRLVFLARPGPSGGGGNRQLAPTSRAQAVGRDRLTLPVAPPIVSSSKPADVPRPPQQVLLDAVPLASGNAFQIGTLEAPSSLGFSQGPGSGGGVGEGTGTGIGSGTGPGVGPGSGGGTGGGVYRAGNGVSLPTLVSEVKPTYTVGALLIIMDFRIE